MTVTLYEATVERYIQALAGLETVMAKGRAHFAETGVDPEQVIEHRLWEDMQPFSFQVVAASHLALGSIQGAKSGAFGFLPPQQRSYQQLQAMVSDALKGLRALTREEVNALEGGDMVMRAGQKELPFVVERFLLSFVLPNVFFHVTTAYDILRLKGTPIGKMDYLGGMELKT